MNVEHRDDPETLSVQAQVIRVTPTASTRIVDHLAIEEPLEIRVESLEGAVRRTKSLAITMRTPGHDEELAAGFLFSEGVIRESRDIIEIVACGAERGAHDGQNIVKVRLADHATVDWPKLERHFYSTSSCGVCGKSSLDALDVPGIRPIPREGIRLSREAICSLQEKMRADQSVFHQTGGLHAAALFSDAGELVDVREDVGRHNAVDKLLGARFTAGETPLSNRLLFLSGRASFELVQKASVAGIPMVVAVGAPSSLAVELAKRFGMTLIGFVRDERFNIYHGEWRVQ